MLSHLAGALALGFNCAIPHLTQVEEALDPRSLMAWRNALTTELL